jgi:hypothetical protein
MKTFLKVLAVLAVILIIGFVALSLTLDGIIKSNIESVGSDLLQTDVQVEDVSVSLFDGKGHIDGITIENPEGFSDSAAVKLQAIDIEMDLSSLLSDTMLIDSLIIQQPEVYVEQTLQGNNIKALQENLAQSSTSESGGLIIDYLLVEDGVVTLSTNIGGARTAQVELERFEQEAIGRAGSNTVKSSVQQILEPVLEHAAREALEGGVREKVEDKLKDLLDGQG